MPFKQLTDAFIRGASLHCPTGDWTLRSLYISSTLSSTVLHKDKSFRVKNSQSTLGAAVSPLRNGRRITDLFNVSSTFKWKATNARQDFTQNGFPSFDAGHMCY